MKSDPEIEMKEHMIETMTKSDDETQSLVDTFVANIEQGRKEFDEKRRRGDVSAKFYYVVRSAFWQTFKWDFIANGMSYLVSTICTMAQAAFLQIIIEYITEIKVDLQRAGIYLGIYALLLVGQTIFSNHHKQNGSITAVNVRVTLTAALYEKLTRLNMRSLKETNSGKLITIVCGDLQVIEYSFTMVHCAVGVPVLNLLVYIYIGIVGGWYYALVTFLMWMFILFCQIFSSKHSKSLMGKYGGFNDER